MRITHTKCGGLVVVNLNASFDFYSFLTISSKETIKLSNIFIKTINNKPELYCIGCKETLNYSHEDLSMECVNCHKIKPLSDFRFYNKDSDMTYCIDCINENNVVGYHILFAEKIKF